MMASRGGRDRGTAVIQDRKTSARYSRARLDSLSPFCIRKASVFPDALARTRRCGPRPIVGSGARSRARRRVARDDQSAMAAAPNGSPRGGDGSPSLPMLSPAIGSSSGAFSVVPLGPSDASGSRSTTTTRPQDRGMRRRHQSVALNSNTSPSLDFSRIAGSPRLQQESWRELARRRMPALGSLAVGVLVGLIFAFAISGSGVSLSP